MKLGWRPMAWGVVVAGVLLGRQGDAPRPAPLRHGDAVVLAVDFHVHSFPGDGSVAPWDLAVEARRRGLDAIALTNHNHRLQWMVTQALPFHPDGALLIPGEELTSVGYHMAVAGTERNVAWRQSAADAAARIHDEGGIAIAAHPAGEGTTGFDDRAIDLVDGVEAAHPLIYDFEDGRRDLSRFYARAKARRPTIAAIGSTDFHFFAPVGFCRKFVFARRTILSAILDAVRRGATAPGRERHNLRPDRAVGRGCGCVSRGRRRASSRRNVEGLRWAVDGVVGAAGPRPRGSP